MHPSTSAPVLVRRAASSDAALCAFVHHTAWREAYAHLLPADHWETDTLTRREQRWHQILASGKHVEVAEKNGEIVGFAVAEPARSVGGHEPVRATELTSIYVLAAHYGSGISRMLLDAALPPETPAQLWVLEQNPRARRFYERHGFAFDGTRFTDPDLGLSELRYVR